MVVYSNRLFTKANVLLFVLAAFYPIVIIALKSYIKDDFYRMLDNIENVNVLEDPNIEKGGCIIETDFGDIDARISAQLDEIETAIKNIQPIKDA